MPDKTAITSPPQAAVWLGGLGILPFLALAVTAWFASAEVMRTAVAAQVAYGAVILSFIAGAHWGFASHSLSEGNTVAARKLLGFSVLPSLVGWLALLLAPPWSAALLGFAFAAILFLDRWALTIAFAPSWWLRLRLPLSATVAALQFITFAAAFVRFGTEHSG